MWVQETLTEANEKENCKYVWSEQTNQSVRDWHHKENKCDFY